MILVALLLVLLLLAICLRALGGTGPLNDVERRYTALIAVPFLLAIVVPAAMRLGWGYALENKRWIELAGSVGLMASALMGVWGISLVVGAIRKRRAWGWPLGVAVLIAGGPALIVYATTWLLKLMG